MTRYTVALTSATSMWADITTSTANDSVTYTVTAFGMTNSRTGGLTERCYFSLWSYDIDIDALTNYTVREGQTSYSWTVSVSDTVPRGTSSYTVEINARFFNNGGTTDVTKTLVTFTVPARPSYTVSYAANGGSSTPQSQTKWYNYTLSLRDSISHANTNPGNYTVTLNHNYTGSSNGSLTSTRTVKYAFSAWKCSANNTNYSAGGTLPASVNQNCTMTAQWSTSETRTDVILPTLSRSGFSFVRWNTNGSNTGVGYNGGSKYNPSGNVTLYAIWNRTVTFNANGGSGAPNDQTALSTSAITLSTTKPKLAGYKFVKWNTKWDGSGTDYESGAIYAAQNPSITLYAQWAPNIDSVTVGLINAARVASSSSTDGSDEGTYLYATVPFTVKGYAAASISISATLTDQDGQYADFIAASGQSYDSTTTHALTQTLSGGSGKTLPEDFTGTFILRASGLDTDKTYTLSATVSATNTSVTQDAVSDTKGALIQTAYYTMDLLGDSHYYNVSADTSVNSSKTYYQVKYAYYLTSDGSLDPNKTYYMRLGSGPYTYSAVINPSAANISKYYERKADGYEAIANPSGNPHNKGYLEATGERPGHGVSFGSAATVEGFNVSMAPYGFTQPLLNVHMFSTISIATQWFTSNTKALPAVVLALDTLKLYLVRNT